MLTTLLATALTTSLAAAPAQTAAAPDLATVRQWFEAGQDQQVVAIKLNDDSDPALIFLVAQSHERQQQRAQARAAYDRLAARPQTDPWHFIGRSAVLLGDRQPAQGVTAAEQGVRLGPQIADAHLQLGLAYGDGGNWAGRRRPPSKRRPRPTRCWPTRTTTPGTRITRSEGRLDLMAKFFEYFLKLAPNAPERANVESIMRTVRGR